jgi:hypothetical protein
MRVSDLRALLAGVSDDAWVVVADDDGHASPVEWSLHTATVPGEPQSVVLILAPHRPDQYDPALCETCGMPWPCCTEGVPDA